MRTIISLYPRFIIALICLGLVTSCAKTKVQERTTGPTPAQGPNQELVASHTKAQTLNDYNDVINISRVPVVKEDTISEMYFKH